MIQGNYTIKQTIVPVLTTSVQLIGANPNRKYLAFLAQGSQDVTITPGIAPAMVGAGPVLVTGASSKQSNGAKFEAGAPINAFQCIAGATGSTVIVWEGE